MHLLRERMERNLLSLGKEELMELAEKTTSRASMSFCNSKYNLPEVSF